MAELFAKDTGTCRGTGGSMHIYDVDTHFQGGWALVSEQLPYAAGAARSILLDRHLDPEDMKDDDRISVVFIGEGGAQNGRMAECLNAAAKENLPVLFFIIDNGRAINTFTDDVAQNMNIFEQGQHYGVPGIKVDGSNLEDTLKTGRAVIDYVRRAGAGNGGPAMIQVHTYRFQGHSPADPEHERGRKAEKMWARQECDPIKIFEATSNAGNCLKVLSDSAKAEAAAAVEFKTPSRRRWSSAPGSRAVGHGLQQPPCPTENAEAITKARRPGFHATCQRIDSLRAEATAGTLSIGDALNLAILEEMIRDPKTTCKAEDLQAGSRTTSPS